MKLFVILAAAFILLYQSGTAQSEKVKSYLNKISAGKIEEVRQQLPDLLAAYPQDPGVQLILGIVVEDPYLSLDKYKLILKGYPDSEWADDAYLRIVETYCLLGDTGKAVKAMEDFRIKYPKSEFLTLANDFLNTSMKIARNSNGKENKDKVNVSDITNVKEQAQDTKKTQQKPADTKSEPAIGKIPGVTYALQVGVYSTPEAAKAEMDKYKKQRLVAEIKQKDIEGNTMYSVIIGNYSSKETAEEEKNRLQQSCKCEPIVIKRGK